jgi:hypothetical protein
MPAFTVECSVAFQRKYLFLLFVVLALGAFVFTGPVKRSLCSAAAARSAEHRDPCTGEILNRVLLRINAGADGLADSALALEFRHVFPGKDPFYETLRVEFAAFHAGQYVLGSRGSPVVRYTAGVLGQPKLRCVRVVKAGSVDAKESAAGGIEATIDVKPDCVISPGVGTTQFTDAGTYAELRDLRHQ